MTITVKTQAELDQALADGADGIVIDSPAGVWIYLSGSATVRAYGSATVWAYDSATVSAYDSATVSAYDSATVRASGSATVWAYDSATVSATQYVAVHLHSKRVTLDGDGHIIDVTDLNLTDPTAWANYNGLTIETIDGHPYVEVYKAVNHQWTTNRGTNYAPGSLPEAEDWEPTDECGHGLHFSQTPVHASRYHPEATRWIRCGVRLDELVVITGWSRFPDKIKARRAVTPCVEVDINGREVTR